MKACARASTSCCSRTSYVKEQRRVGKRRTQNVVDELYGSGGIWGKVSAGEGDFNCMHERQVVCGRRDGRHADWLDATNGPIPTQREPFRQFFKKKKNRELKFRCSVCRAVPVFSLAYLSFIYVLLAGRFSSFTRRSTVSADRISQLTNSRWTCISLLFPPENEVSGRN
jgi:hypothetical protein